MAARVAGAFGRLPGVRAVALAGSRVAGAPDDLSDVDLYVYAAATIALEDRFAIASGFSVHHEIGNALWEPGDEWIDDRSGVHVDVMYRMPAWIEDQLDRVLVRHEASLGSSTCLWHNVLHSMPLFDRVGWYRALQASADRPYPKPLQAAIIAKNHPILRGTLSSYRAQIERAARRRDRVAVHHRITALLASYFDILFALNELPHPGEKRLIQLALSRCGKTPPHLERQIDAVLEVAARPATMAATTAVDVLLDGLDGLLTKDGLLPLSPRPPLRIAGGRRPFRRCDPPPGMDDD